MTRAHEKLIATFMLGSFFLGGCGRELTIEPRRTMTVDDIAQHYKVTVFSTSEGAKSYTVTASFLAGTGAGAHGIVLPDGDTLTLIGAAMTAGTSDVFSTSGSGNPRTFAFVWTHESTAYANTLTATAYEPAAIPTTISKTSDATIAISGVPAGTTVSATVNNGNKIAAPFFAVPLQVTGGGAAAKDSSNFSGLTSGVGALAIIEVTEPALQSPTSAGGSALVTVQFGYNVSITD